MTTLYNSEVAKALRQYKKPYPFTAELVEFSWGFELRVFEEEVLDLNDSKLEGVAVWLKATAEAIRALGPHVRINMAKGRP